jgi:DSF synthase
MNAVIEFPTLSTISNFTQLEIDFEKEIRTLFTWMQAAPRPCFNPTLLDEIRRCEQLLEANQGHVNDRGQPERVDFVVFGSRTPGVFNLGGDLSLFMQSIMRRDRETLHRYAHLCIDNVYRRASGFGCGVTSIALIQGKALGGGFESALAADLIVAERSSTMSFPEVLFNMFPGMGALSFLARRVGSRKAEDIITSGQVFSCKEMYDLGVVDEMVEDGLGLAATRHIIRNRQKRANSHRAVQLAKRYLNPVTDSELRSIVDVWVDAALRLDSRDLRMMARLVRAQDKLMALSPEEQAVELLYAPEPLNARSGT